MVNKIVLDRATYGLAENIKQCSLLQLEISPARIHFLKFILEGYDGLALLSTVDARQGRVEIHYPPEIERDLKGLLHSLEPQLIKSIL